MATLNNAVQSLIDNLYGKMTSNTPLTAEEQTLVAAAIEKLTNQTNWEKALVAVAEQHLDEATQNMAQNLATSTSALTSAQTDINTAKTEIQTQNANLSLLPTVDNKVNGLAKSVFGITPIEAAGTETTSRRSPSIFAVYDANGDTYAVRPSYTIRDDSQHDNRLEYLHMPAAASGVTILKSHYVNASTYYQEPVSYIHSAASTAMLPLASKNDINDIAYETVYSLQMGLSDSADNYAGLYCASSGYASVTKPKKGLLVNDQWGLFTTVNHNWWELGVLYDNNKHCLVVVDEVTSNLVEKYRDGNIVTTTNIADSNALQLHVNSGDFTVVKFIALQVPWLNCYRRYDGAATNNSLSHYLDCYTYYGKVGGVVAMGGTRHSSHYRFTEDKKLEPLTFYASSSVTNNQTASSTGQTNSFGEVNVAITDGRGNTLGSYHYQNKTDDAGYDTGYIISAIMCMNPYSHAGILNDGYSFYNAQAYYGNSRTCKAF